jgi:hypothetical protein
VAVSRHGDTPDNINDLRMSGQPRLNGKLRLLVVTQPSHDRYSALGQVVEMAAVMEVSLQMAFCALLGSKYAAVVAGSQEAHWLIGELRGPRAASPGAARGPSRCHPPGAPGLPRG